MVWFKVDDGLHDHRKVRRAKKAAMGIWLLAGSWSSDNLTDGFVPAEVIARWGGTAADARALVHAGFWEPDEQGGERGWRFLNWDEYQPTRAEVERMRQAKSEAGRIGGKASGRSRREASAQAPASSLVEAESNSRTRTRPLSVVATSGQSSSAPRELDNDGLTRIQQALNGCPKVHAERTANFVLAKAPVDVRNPTAYILAAIKEDPDAYRYRRGNPKPGQQCDIHAAEWADHCRGCAIDRKVADA